jgi:ubiquinone/menaquinone biosynthesis C-methylase UbiE
MVSQGCVSNETSEIARFDGFLGCWKYNTQLHLWRYVFASEWIMNKLVLDVACGVGYGSDWLSNNIGSGRLIGIDLSKQSLGFAQRHYHSPCTDFVLGNGLSLPIATQSLDVVVSFETIEHIPASQQANFVAEVHRVLKPGGVFLCSTPNRKLSPGHVDHTREFAPTGFFEIHDSYFGRVERYGQYITVEDLEFQRSQTKRLSFQVKRKRARILKLARDWINQTPTRVRLKNRVKQALRKDEQTYHHHQEPVYVSHTLVNELDERYAPVPISDFDLLFGLFAVAHRT